MEGGEWAGRMQDGPMGGIEAPSYKQDPICRTAAHAEGGHHRVAFQRTLLRKKEEKEGHVQNMIKNHCATHVWTA